LKVGIWPDKGSGPLSITSVRVRNDEIKGNCP